MADTQMTEYALGYHEGLNAGFEQGLRAKAGLGSGEPSPARKAAAWFVLGAGILGAAGVVMMSRKEGVAFGTTIVVGSTIMTSLVASLQVLSNRSGPRL